MPSLRDLVGGFRVSRLPEAQAGQQTQKDPLIKVDLLHPRAGKNRDGEKFVTFNVGLHPEAFTGPLVIRGFRYMYGCIFPPSTRVGGRWIQQVYGESLGRHILRAICENGWPEKYEIPFNGDADHAIEKFTLDTKTAEAIASMKVVHNQ